MAFALVCFSLCHGTTQELFLQANKLYQEHEYQRALELYQTIEHKGPAVWYNMGNAAYNLNQYVDARVFWERAKCGATRAELADITYNNEMLDQQFEEQPQTIDAWESMLTSLQAYAASFSMLFLQLLILSLTLIMCILLRSALSMRFVIIVCLCIVYVPAMMLTGSKMAARSRCVAVMKDEQASLFTGPDEQFHVIEVVPQGTRLVLEQEHGQWCKARYAAVVGWIKKDTMVIA